MDEMNVSGRVQAHRSGVVTRPRAAVSLLFLMNGSMVGCWAPKIPEFAERLQLSKFELGLMILVFGLGSLVLMPLAGMQIAARGSRTVVKATAVLVVPMPLALTMTDSVWSAGVAVFLFGGLVGAMDVAMNANAVAVEAAMRRSIMSSCHAFWSAGCLIGAALGGYLISHWGVLGHAQVATVLAIIFLAAAWPMIFADKPHLEAKKPKARLPMMPLPWLLGMMALFCMIPEGAILDWSALYLREHLGASVTLSGFGFAAFSLSMSAMRFAGDVVRDRFGAVRTLRVSTVFAIAGLLLVSLAPDAPLALVGFALCGVGISNMVPIAFSAAGNVPGLQPGIGISVVTTMGYSGMLAAPSLIGFAAEHFGFSVVFMALPALSLIVLAMSGLARYADGVHQGSH